MAYKYDSYPNEVHEHFRKRYGDVTKLTVGAWITIEPGYGKPRAPSKVHTKVIENNGHGVFTEANIRLTQLDAGGIRIGHV